MIIRLTNFNREPDGFARLMSALNLGGWAVEIGCAAGGHAKMLLKHAPLQSLCMVDPWIRQPTDVYKEDTTKVNYDAWYEECVALAHKDRRVRLMRTYSVVAASGFKDDTFDLVYIDGNHDYQPVLDDINAWWPKLRKGGIFAGHDFYNATVEGHCCHVEDAVTEWAAGRGLPIFVGACTSWFTFKTH